MFVYISNENTIFPEFTIPPEELALARVPLRPKTSFTKFRLKQAYQSIVLAVQKGSDGEVISNPPIDYRLENNDYLLIVAHEKPQPLAKPSKNG